MSTEIRRVHLEYVGGTSYKEYNIIITQNINGLYDLKSHYGRIGGSQVNRDIKLGVNISEAMSQYSEILRKKEKKGYVIITQENMSRFTDVYVSNLTQTAATLVAEGVLERNHYAGLKKLLQASDIETLEMAEKIVIANQGKMHENVA
tara:strand:+ start:3066 stop:3509 length:444 start_codon:yes stop_codon:yes gene_type:complete